MNAFKVNIKESRITYYDIFLESETEKYFSSIKSAYAFIRENVVNFDKFDNKTKHLDVIKYEGYNDDQFVEVAISEITIED